LKTLTHERDGHRVRAHAVARDAGTTHSYQHASSLAEFSTKGLVIESLAVSSNVPAVAARVCQTPRGTSDTRRSSRPMATTLVFMPLIRELIQRRAAAMLGDLLGPNGVRRAPPADLLGCRKILTGPAPGDF